MLPSAKTMESNIQNPQYSPARRCRISYAPVKQDSQPGGACASPNGQRIRTLIVDDSPVVLDTLGSFLGMLDCFSVVGVARDGAQAVSLAGVLRPDLVLMDLHMPEMNGLEATRHLKARPHAPRVIIMTLDESRNWREAARKAGADGFVPKLDLFEQLPATLRMLFGERIHNPWRVNRSAGPGGAGLLRHSPPQQPGPAGFEKAGA